MRMLVFLLIAIGWPACSQTPSGQTDHAVAGKAVFGRCTACHDIGDGAVNRMGPVLTGVVGRPAASVERFGYSAAMKKARDRGLIWTPETLDTFLAGPRDFVPGTKMPNIKVPDAADRANLIAYLETFSPGFEPGKQMSTGAPPN